MSLNPHPRLPGRGENEKRGRIEKRGGEDGRKMRRKKREVWKNGRGGRRVEFALLTKSWISH